MIANVFVTAFLLVNIFGLSFAFAAEQTFARSVYLNGVDISSVSNQQLKNVTIQIDEKGDVYITASHYQVHEEKNYVPLSKTEVLANPMHKPPKALGRYFSDNPILTKKGEKMKDEQPSAAPNKPATSSNEMGKRYGSP